ncbi:MAG: CDP-diacylglycerol--glycerol-3-phosphate 3-phosphatidyltransferase [Candidatus Margulisbacteria bacterium]|nr:CDP-diacylglycerol--glycerol-3-phosphate 3-phosphatidyltransferase [Candidatus Margulisiibacteriota bacterium]
MTLANRITLLRIIFIPLVIILLLYGIDGLAVIVFLFLSFSDAVDGYIARKFNEVSDLGKFLDPLADKILVITVLIALVGLGKASSIPVMIFVARDFIVSGIRLNAARSKDIIAASPVAKWKTGAQIVAVAMLILSLPLANEVLWLSVVLSILSGGAYVWQSRILKLLKLS